MNVKKHQLQMVTVAGLVGKLTVCTLRCVDMPSPPVSDLTVGGPAGFVLPLLLTLGRRVLFDSLFLVRRLRCRLLPECDAGPSDALLTLTPHHS